MSNTNTDIVWQYDDQNWPPTLVADSSEVHGYDGFIRFTQVDVIEMQKQFARHRLGNTPQCHQEQPAPYDSPDISGETASHLGSNF